MKTAGLAAAGAIAFVILATANSGGYRYGVSDQAFYLPAVQQQLDPGLFPRDTPLLEAQSHLMVSDQLIAAAVNATGASLPTVAITLYVMTLLLCFAAAIAFARGLALPWWAVTLLVLLLTFRHRIAKTGANSLEGYLHPRQLAFGMGIAALACLVRDRGWAALAFVALAAVVHPTTALWFGVAVGIGLVARFPQWRRVSVPALVIGAAFSLWTILAGPLKGRLVTMDALWLGVLAEKDYLFPMDWPIDAWLINLAYPVVIWFAWRARVRAGTARPGEHALVAGCLALTALFLVSVPLTAVELALAVQLQVTRVFWVLDFVALTYVAWWLARSTRVAVVACVVLALASGLRGYYVLEVLQPERRLVTVALPDTDWVDAMTWLGRQPDDWHVLADPGHAWKYGVSVRLAAEKDTMLESVKDSALALYDREIAERVAERTPLLADYDQLSTRRAIALGAAYHLAAAIVEARRPLNLPLLYRNDTFAIYDLRGR